MQLTFIDLAINVYIHTHIHTLGVSLIYIDLYVLIFIHTLCVQLAHGTSLLKTLRTFLNLYKNTTTC